MEHGGVLASWQSSNLAWFIIMAGVKDERRRACESTNRDIYRNWLHCFGGFFFSESCGWPGPSVWVSVICGFLPRLKDPSAAAMAAEQPPKPPGAPAGVGFRPQLDWLCHHPYGNCPALAVRE